MSNKKQILVWTKLNADKSVQKNSIFLKRKDKASACYYEDCESTA